MKNKTAAIIFSLTVTVLASALSVQAEDNKRETITLTDNVGREVELECPVDTAVSALRYNNELIRACGAIDHIISVDLNTAQDREYWGMFDPEEVIGKSQKELDYEKIVAVSYTHLTLPTNSRV